MARDQFTLPPTYTNTPSSLTVLCHHNRSPWPGTSLHCHPLTPTFLTGLTVITIGLDGQGPVYTATHLHQHSLQVSLFHHNRSVARDQFTLPPTYTNTPYRSLCFITTGLHGQGPVYTATHLHQHSLQVSVCCVITTGLRPGTSLHCHPPSLQVPFMSSQAVSTGNKYIITHHLTKVAK